MKMPRDKKAHRTFGDVFGRIGQADFATWRSFIESSFLGWAGFILLCTAITFLMTFSISNIPERIVSGTFAQHDIRADRDYEIVDDEATREVREDAVASVLDVYDYWPDLSRKITENVSRVFEEFRSKAVAGEELESLHQPLEQALGISVSNIPNFSRQFEDAIVQQIIASMARYIVSSAEEVAKGKEKGIIVRQGDSDERTLTKKEVAYIPVAEDVRKKLIEGRYSGAKKFPASSEIAAQLIRPNVTFNMQETETRKGLAADGIKSKIIKVEAGEIIIRAGQRYEPQHVTILAGVKGEKEKTFTPLKVAGTFWLVALTILTAYYFAERYIRKFAPRKGDLYFLGSVLLLMLIIVRLSITLSRGMHDSVWFDVPLTALYYAIPVAGAAMLVRFILNSETSLVFSLVLSVLAGVFAGKSLNYTTYSLISCIAASASIAYADKRSSIMKAGLYTSMVNIVAVLSIQFINASSLVEPLTFLNVVWYVLFAVIGGFSCAVFVTMLTPLAEYIFGYTTDIKLLELANLNHPLLRELVIRAPGTYHHSHLVGILAESACETISANPLLARVAAYYHDIGKIRKPLYFVENTPDCDSKYESLTPHMSALIVLSHVKDGMELAREYKIPKRISDMIIQHHGTKMISFFYERAKKQNDPAAQKLDEKDFHYPGPKPQTREAGILLLADSVEAAVRSLKEKSPSRIQQMVEDVINSSFVEAQLDECDLTLRNLHDIAKSFTKILMGIYHQRIEYPKETLQASSGNGVVKL